MRFPNAYSGVKKIFTSQILSIIASVCALIAIVLSIVTVTSTAAQSEDAAAYAGVGTVLFFAASAVLMIISYIIHLVGLARGGRDEEMIRKAFWIAILALVVTVVQGILSSIIPSGIGDNIASIIQSLCNIFITVFVVQGIANLADQLNDSRVSAMSTKILTIMIIFYALTVIAQLITIIFRNSEAAATIANIMMMIASILSIINFIIYLVYLGRAKKMLREN